MVYAALRFLMRQFPVRELMATGRFIPIPAWLKRVLSLYPPSKRVLPYARLCLGQHVFAGVPQEVACANSVTGILEMVDPTFFGGSSTVNRINGTYTLSSELSSNDRFMRVQEYVFDRVKNRGTFIILSPTGKGNGKMVGHVGIYDPADGKIMSNNSATGVWEKNYTLKSWIFRWEYTGGIKTEYWLILY